MPVTMVLFVRENPPGGFGMYHYCYVLIYQGRGARWWECCGLSNSRLVVVAYIFIRRRITRVYMAGFDFAYKHSRSYKLNAV